MNDGVDGVHQHGAPDPLPVAFAEGPAQRWLWAIARRDGDALGIAAGRRRIVQAWARRLEVLQPGLRVLIAEASDTRADQAWSSGTDEIGIGLALAARIDAACLQLAAQLTMAYYNQSLGVGPALPLPLLVPAQRFASEALGLSPERLTARAVDPAGEVRPLIDNLLGAMASLRQGQTLQIADLRAAGARIPKPLRFGTSLSEGQALLGTNAGSRPVEPQPHLVVLYAQVLSDAIGFVLAHEAAHLRHGDAAPPADSADERRREIAADAAAIRMLAGIEGCNLRSVALLYACIAETEDPLPDAWMSHPFATDRLGLLAAALPPEADASSRADLEVALQLVRKPLPVWGAGCDGKRSRAWYAADLEHRAVIELQAVDRDGQALEGCDVHAQWCLYDRTDPDVAWRRGSVRLRPLQDWSFDIALPPSLWLDHPDAGLRVDGLEVAAAGTWCGEGDAPRFASATRLSDDDAIAAAKSMGSSRTGLLALACMRAVDAEPPVLAERLLPLWIAARAATGGERRPTLLRWLARRWAVIGRTAQARALLEEALRDESYLPEGLRGLLGGLLWADVAPRLPPAAADSTTIPGDTLADADCELLDRSRDLMMREQALFASNDKPLGAPQLPDVLRQAHRTPLGRAFLDSLQARRQGDALVDSDRAQAADWYGHAAQTLFEALLHAKAELPYHWQIAGEHLLAHAVTGGEHLDAVLPFFDRVLSQDPSFLPAWTEAAKTAMEAGDLPRTERYLDAADRLFPAHSFIEYVRRECRRRRRAEETRLIELYTAAYAAGRWDEAGSQAEALDTLSPASGQGAYALGMLELRRERYAQACGHLQRAVEQGDALFEWSCAWAEAQARGGDAMAAWQTLTIAIGGAEHAPSTDSNAGKQSPYIGYGTRQGMLIALLRRDRLALQLGLPQTLPPDIAAEVAAVIGVDDRTMLHWPASCEITVSIGSSGPVDRGAAVS